MIANGLISEVQSLIEEHHIGRDMVSMQGLGYKEIASYLSGEISLDEAIYILKRDTRHFAKRQLTWFKRERDVIWLDKDIYRDNDTQMNFISGILKDKGIIQEG